jgi:hypothetical protein
VAGAESGDRSFVMRFSRRALFSVAVISLGGCATAPDIKQLGQSPLNVPVKTLVMESPMAVDQDRLHAVLAPDSRAGSQASNALISSGEEHAQEFALAAMQSDLEKQARLEVVTPAAKDNALVDKIQGENLASAITQDEADKLHSATGADALLRFGITDYGQTPKTWRSGYITFEVVTTLGLAAIIASPGTAVAKAAAGTYLAEETVEETAEGYAGFWALDVVYRPVRIEAELIRLNPVATVWDYSDTGLSDRSLSRLTSKVSPAERDKQLDQATDDAVRDIVSTLASSMKRIN